MLLDISSHFEKDQVIGDSFLSKCFAGEFYADDSFFFEFFWVGALDFESYGIGTWKEAEKSINGVGLNNHHVHVHVVLLQFEWFFKFVVLLLSFDPEAVCESGDEIFFFC